VTAFQAVGEFRAEHFISLCKL